MQNLQIAWGNSHQKLAKSCWVEKMVEKQNAFPNELNRNDDSSRPGKWEKSVIYRFLCLWSFSMLFYLQYRAVIYSISLFFDNFVCLKTFLCLVSPVNLQGTVNLKSSKIRKYCKFLHDTTDRKFCKPEKSTLRFQVVTFLSFWGTLYIYILCSEDVADLIS